MTESLCQAHPHWRLPCPACAATDCVGRLAEAVEALKRLPERVARPLETENLRLALQKLDAQARVQLFADYCPHCGTQTPEGVFHCERA